MSRDTVFSGRVMAGVVEYRRLAFRALVLQAAVTGLPAVWEPVPPGGEDLMAAAAGCCCSARVRRLCWPCPHREVCLAAALWLDDDRPWVAGMSRAARVKFFDELVALAGVVEPWTVTGRPAT